MIVKREHGGFFDGDASGTQAAIGERLRGKLGGALILLPGADFGGEAQLFAETGFFKCGADDESVAFLRNQNSEQAFAGPPVDSGEIKERSAGRNEQRIELGILFGEKFLHAGDARLKFFGGDGLDAGAERLERVERRGKGTFLFLLGKCFRWGERGNGRDRCCGRRGLDQLAASKTVWRRMFCGGHGLRACAVAGMGVKFPERANSERRAVSWKPRTERSSLDELARAGRQNGARTGLCRLRLWQDWRMI